jgi:hypothetical protein
VAEKCGKVGDVMSAGDRGVLLWCFLPLILFVVILAAVLIL